ncbi:unnamed protein product [Ixodes pacificus]
MIEDLVKEGRLAGSLVGGRSERASYIPDLYSRSQGSWVDTCYHQNGYLEYDALTRLGIQDPKGYVKRRFKDDGLVFLKNLCLGQTLLAQVEAAVDEVAATGAWVDLAPLLPSVFSAEEVSSVIQAALKSRPKGSAAVQQLLDTMVVSEAFVETCMRSFDPLMTAKAELVRSEKLLGIRFETIQPKPLSLRTQNPLFAHDYINSALASCAPQEHEHSEETRRRAQSTCWRPGMKMALYATHLKKGSEVAHPEQRDDKTCPCGRGPGRVGTRTCCLTGVLLFCLMSSFVPPIGFVSLHRQPRRSEGLRRLCRYLGLFLKSQQSSPSACSEFHSSRITSMPPLSGTAVMLTPSCPAIGCADDLQSVLGKHLLKTLCSDFTNLVVGYLAMEQGAAKEADVPPNMAPEVRLKWIQKLPADIKGPVLKLHQSLSAKTTEDFLADVDVVLGAGVCDMIIRSDKKKESRQALHGHRQALLAQLAEAREAALCLHLAVLLVAQAQTQRMVHASGKFVPQLVAFLRTQLPPEVFATLHEAQELVMKHLTLDDTSEEKSEVASKLEELIPRLKELGATYKRQGTTEE